MIDEVSLPRSLRLLTFLTALECRFNGCVVGSTVVRLKGQLISFVLFLQIDIIELLVTYGANMEAKTRTEQTVYSELLGCPVLFY